MKKKGYKKGDWLVICDRCGHTKYASECRKTWEGWFVCADSCWEPKHPQENVKSRVDMQRVPIARPRSITMQRTTTLSSAASLDDRSIYVVFVGNISKGDGIGITYDDGSIEWTFVSDTPSTTVDGPDRDGIITAFVPDTEGSLTLDGVLVSGSVATLTSPRKISIYADADSSGATFTIVGTDNIGASISEGITGPDTTTVYSTYTYKTVTSIILSGTDMANVEIGQAGDNITVETVPLNDKIRKPADFGNTVYISSGTNFVTATQITATQL